MGATAPTTPEQDVDVITVGGVDDREPVDAGGSGPRPKGPVLGLAGLVVGLAMGAVFAGGTGETSVTTTTLPEEVIAPSASMTTTTTSPPRPSRLATRAPGLSDNLVIVAVDSTGITKVELWEPADIAPGPSSLPVGTLATDISGQWLGAVTDSRYQVFDNLWVGNSRYLETIALEVTGFTWHSRLPARLAYTSGRDERALYTAQLPLGRVATPTRVTDVGPDEVPVWFHEGGVVLFDGAEDALRLVNDTGGTVGAIDSVAPIAGSAGALAVTLLEEEDRAVLLDRNLAEIGDAPWGEECRLGSFSPATDGPVAFLCETASGQTLQVWGPPEDAGAALPPGPETFELLVEIPATGFRPPAWDSAGRMVLATKVDPIRPSTQFIVYDTLTDSRYTLQYGGTVIQVQIVVP